MHWINIQVDTLDSVEFVGSDPVERATWLCLMRYCVGQENSGRIRGCRDWSDRKWQQVCRVTAAEVQSATSLLTWDGNDLLVFAYPVAKEAEVQSKRKAGQDTANKRWHGRVKSSPQRSASGSAIGQQDEAGENSSANAEGKGRERNSNGREEQPVVDVPVEPLASFPKTKEAATSHAPFVGCTPDFAEKTWSKAMGRGGRDAKDIPIRNWRHYLSSEWAFERERQHKATLPRPEGGSAPVVPLWAQIKAVEEQIERINGQLRAIPNYNSSVFPDEAKAAETKRKPLREQKVLLIEKLQKLRDQEANGGTQL